MNQDTIFSQTPHTRLIRGDAELRKVTECISFKRSLRLRIHFHEGQEIPASVKPNLDNSR